MNISRKKWLMASLMAACVAVPAAHAAVSADEAAKLKTTLTPYGAERAANKAGTIPEWTGGVSKPPANYKAGEHRPDLFAGEKPLYTVTAQNMEQYKAVLSEGQIALFKKNPETFKMNVYPTHRTAAAPQWVYDNIAKNATTGKLVEGGNGVSDAYGGVPFPMPQNGLEAIWNHLLRWNGPATFKQYLGFTVYEDGSMAYNGGASWEEYPFYRKGQSFASFNGNLYQILAEYEKPARRKGEHILAIDPINQAKTPRQAWQYIPGQRRVRRAPTIAYDTPNPGTNGIMTYDDTFMYNGSPDRYDWTLVGKQELLINYNGYRFMSAMSEGVDEKTLFPPKHPNSDYERWELHRVWVVEANIKSGKRHVYGKRRFFIDEDSWTIAEVNSYDNRGQLWRVMYAHLINAYEVPAVLPRATVAVDLLSNAYVAYEYDEDAIKIIDTMGDDFYTPQSVRKRSRR